MQLTELKRRVKLALQELQKNEQHLLLNGLNERTIASHLAHYLAAHFLEYNVDHEYNGNIDNRKGKKFLDASPVYPDIIIHTRGKNVNNLLIIEVKKTINPGKQQEANEKKLLGYIAEGCEFRYPFGLFLGIGTKSQTGKVRQDRFENEA